MPLPIPLWMLAAGALGTGVGLGVQSQLKNESELKNKGNELLNAHLEDLRQQAIERQQRIRGEISGSKDLFLAPDWVDKVAQARASDKYQNWLRNSQVFELGGDTYRWVEEGSDEYNNNNLIKGKSNREIARMYAQSIEKDSGMLQGSWENLLNEKNRLTQQTGKRYIPVREVRFAPRY